MTQIDKRGVKYYGGSLLAVLIMILFGLLVPAWGSVTETGVYCIGVFLGVIVAVIFTGETLWPAIVAMAMLTIGGYFPSINAAISGVFGHQLVYGYFLITALINAMNDLGTGRVLASKVLTQSGFQKKPLLLSFCFLFVFSIAVIFMSVTGALLLAFPLLDQILDYAGINRTDKYSKLMALGIFLAISLGCVYDGAIMPEFFFRIEFFNEALIGTGLSVNLMHYTVYSFITGTLFLFAYTLAMKYVFKCNFGKLENTDFRDISALTSESHLNKYHIVFLIAFFVFAAAGLVPSSIRSISTMGQYGILGICCIALSFLKRPGENGEKVKLFDFGKYLKTVNWDIAMALGIFSVIGKAMSSDECGIKTWLTDVLDGVLESNGASAIALISIIGVSLLTHVFNNNAVTTIFSSLAAPISVPFIVSGQLNPGFLLAAIALCAQSGFLTMAASGVAPILYKREGINNKFIWTYGLFAEGLFILITLFTFFTMSAIF